MRGDPQSPRWSTKRLPEPHLNDGGPVGGNPAQSVDQERGKILRLLLSLQSTRTHASGALVEHVSDQVIAGKLGGSAGGLHDGNTAVLKHQMSELVGEGSFPGRQSLLDYEHIVVGV